MIINLRKEAEAREEQQFENEYKEIRTELRPKYAQDHASPKRVKFA